MQEENRLCKYPWGEMYRASWTAGRSSKAIVTSTSTAFTLL